MIRYYLQSDACSQPHLCLKSQTVTLSNHPFLLHLALTGIYSAFLLVNTQNSIYNHKKQAYFAVQFL